MRWPDSLFRFQRGSHVGVGIIWNNLGAHRCRHVVRRLFSLFPAAVRYEAEPGLKMGSAPLPACLAGSQDSPTIQARGGPKDVCELQVQKLRFIERGPEDLLSVLSIFLKEELNSCRVLCSNGHYYHVSAKKSGRCESS